MVAAVVLGCLPVSSAGSRPSPRGRRRPLVVSAIRDTRSVRDQTGIIPNGAASCPPARDWPTRDRPVTTVQQLLYNGFMSVGFRPTEEDLRVIEANRREDEKTSDVIRRALRLLDREAWEERARADMHRLRSEDLSAEADAWEYDTDGNIRISGTGLTVPARPADHP